MKFRLLAPWLLVLGMVIHAGWVAAQHADHARATSARKAVGLSVGAAFSPAGELWIVGLDEQSRMFVQSTPDAGKTWSARRTLDARGDAISADGENRPKIAFGRNGVVVVTYTKPLSKPYTGDIRMLRSTDAGKTFSAPFTVHDDRQLITHRFESVKFDRNGDLYVLWVDKRDAELARQRGGGRRDAYDGAAIYGKVSRDGGVTFEPDMKLADHSCECCRIAIVERVDSPELVALWRHVFPNNIRDHAFAALSNLGRERPPQRASRDEWELGACPHHGPGLANAADGGYHMVWFGQRNGVANVHYGRLDSMGTPVGVVRDLPDEMAEHADVVSAGRKVAVVWRSFDGKMTRVRAWVSGDDGATFSVRDLMSSERDNDHPRMAMRGDVPYVVWRTERETYVQQLRW